MAEYTKAAGSTPDAPDSGKKAYIRWNVVGKKGTELSMYQDGADLIVDSKPLLAFVLTLSGATAPQGKHPRVTWSYGASLDNALDGVTNLREQLDKRLISANSRHHSWGGVARWSRPEPAEPHGGPGLRERRLVVALRAEAGSAHSRGRRLAGGKSLWAGTSRLKSVLLGRHVFAGVASVPARPPDSPLRLRRPHKSGVDRWSRSTPAKQSMSTDHPRCWRQLAERCGVLHGRTDVAK